MGQYQVKNLIDPNQKMTMADGTIIQFTNHIGFVPEAYIHLFKSSNFNVQTYFPSEHPFKRPGRQKKDQVDYPSTQKIENLNLISF